MKKLFLIAVAVLAMPFVCFADEAAPAAPKAPAHRHHGDFTILKFDANKDGVVTKDELPKDAKFLAGLFDRIDADKDGKLTKAEDDAFKAEMKKKFEARKAAAAKDGKKPFPPKKFDGKKPFPPKFAGKKPFPPKFDADKAVDFIFAQADTNKDGQISREEAKAAVLKAHAKAAAMRKAAPGPKPFPPKFDGKKPFPPKFAGKPFPGKPFPPKHFGKKPFPPKHFGKPFPGKHFAPKCNCTKGGKCFCKDCKCKKFAGKKPCCKKFAGKKPFPPKFAGKKFFPPKCNCTKGG